MNADIFALLLKVSAILAVAALAVLILRQASAAWRHFVWLVAMSSVIVLFALQLIVPPIVVRVTADSPLRAFALPVVGDARASFATPVLNAKGISDAGTTASTLSRDVAEDAINALPAAVSAASSRTGERAISVQHSGKPMPAASNDGSANISKNFITPSLSNAAPHSGAETENINAMSHTRSWTSFRISPEQVRMSLIFAWVFGSLLLLLRTMYAHRQLRQLAQSSRIVRDSALCDELENIGNRLSLKSSVTLLVHHRVNTPCTAGWRNPVIMLPENFSAWSDARRQAVFTHELAHIVRGDSLAQTVAAIACALFWFHPGVWIANRLLRSESERAADDVVIGAGMPAVDYADHLLALANDSVSGNRVPVAAMGMAHRTQLETRLRAMLDVRQSRRLMTRSAQSMFGAAALFAMVPLAGLQARVQDPRQVQPPVRKSAPPIVVPKSVASVKAPPSIVAPIGVSLPIAGPSNVVPPVVTPPAVTPPVAAPNGKAPKVIVPPNTKPPLLVSELNAPLMIAPPDDAPRAGMRTNSSPDVRTTPAVSPPNSSDIALRQFELAPANGDTTFENEISAVPGEELEMHVMSGGNVTVHGWDQPTARLRARLSGNYWRETNVAFMRSTKGITLTTLAEVNGAKLTTLPTGDGGRIRIRGRPTPPPPVTLENEFELWVPKRTNVKFSSPGGDLTLQELEGMFVGATKRGHIKVSNSTGEASLKTTIGDLIVTSSELKGNLHTDCGNVAQWNTKNYVSLTARYNPPGTLPSGRAVKEPLTIIDGEAVPSECQALPQSTQIPGALRDSTIERVVNVQRGDVLHLNVAVTDELIFHPSTTQEVRVRAAALDTKVSPAPFSLVRSGRSVELRSTDVNATAADDTHARFEVWLPAAMPMHVQPAAGTTVNSFVVFGVKSAPRIREIRMDTPLSSVCVSAALAHIVGNLRGTFTCAENATVEAALQPIALLVNGAPHTVTMRMAPVTNPYYNVLLKTRTLRSLPLLSFAADSATFSMGGGTTDIWVRAVGPQADFSVNRR